MTLFGELRTVLLFEGLTDKEFGRGAEEGSVRLVPAGPGEPHFEVRLPVEGPGVEETMAGRDLRIEAGA